MDILARLLRDLDGIENSFQVHALEFPYRPQKHMRSTSPHSFQLPYLVLLEDDVRSLHYTITTFQDLHNDRVLLPRSPDLAIHLSHT